MTPTSPPYDPQDMLGHVLDWPELLEQGYSHSVTLSDSLKKKTSILCCGMGGSAIAASIIGGYVSDDVTVPYEVVRDYTIPAYVGPRTLVLCLSYSGSTEETLACYAAAREAGAAILVVTTGGELAEQAKADGVALVTYPGGLQPRASLPFVIGLQLNIFSRLKYISEQDDDVHESIDHLRDLVMDDQVRRDARVAANALHGRIPIIYGSGFLGEAARRLKGQISENANQTAAYETLPEQNHNALVGFEKPDKLRDTAVFVLLRSALEHHRHSLRFTVTKELLHKHGLPIVELEASGPTPFTALCSSLYWGDLLSVELAYRNGVDPTPEDIIGKLKERLKGSA